MGVTIESENCSADLGYGGFLRFRKKVAVLSNKVFGEHYENLIKGTYLFGDARTAFFEKYDAKTDELIKSNVITPEVANFCYQSDCEGSIDNRQAKMIYDIIKNHDDTICYGYAGRSDCAMFEDLKNMFKDCVENGKEINWS